MGDSGDSPADLVPIFPLDVVLVPGAALPLHIFEPRYRALITDVCGSGAARSFGVISVRPGPELGRSVRDSLAEVGTIAEVIEVDPYPDGRSDVLTIGSRRFRVLEVDSESKPYLRARVEWLEENDGDISPEHVRAARVLCERYTRMLAQMSGREAPDDDLSSDPLRLSYQIAARLRLSSAERQSLLEAETAAARLYASIAALRRESVLISRTRTVPATPSALRVSSTSN